MAVLNSIDNAASEIVCVIPAGVCPPLLINCRLPNWHFLPLPSLAGVLKFTPVDTGDYHYCYYYSPLTTRNSPRIVKMGKKMLNQVVQVKQTHWQAFASCFLGVRLVKNFSSQGLLFGGCGSPRDRQRTGEQITAPCIPSEKRLYCCRKFVVSYRPLLNLFGEITMLRPFLLFCAVCCLTLSVSAADWMQWRGPDHNGISQETGLLKDWGSDGPKLVWKVNSLGIGYSNLSFANGMIYSMGDRNGNCFLFALDEKTGEEKWNVNVGPAGGTHEGPRCTPATDGKLVFALGQFGDFVCVDAKTGKEYWGGNVEKDLGGKVMSMWHFAASPVIDGDNVVVPIGGEKGTVVAFKKSENFGINWRSSEITDSCGYNSIVPMTFGGKRQYLLFTVNRVAALDAENGKVLWQAECPGRTAICSDPVFLMEGNTCYLLASSAYNTGARFFKVTADGGKFTIEKIAEDNTLQSHHGGIVQVGGHFYFLTQRELACVEPKTGKTLWKNRSVGKGSIMAVDGKLIVRSETGDGDVALVQPSPESYKEICRFSQPERSNKNSWTYPTVYNGKLYIRDQGLLLCYEVK